ncbi:MAG: tetratricopeptide repeat protein [Chitinispirillaceae bacterium]|nr:tetratricopeptide repeat protein [Chitinispirillaceae bacterium]
MKYHFNSTPFCIRLCLMVFVLTRTCSYVGAASYGGYDAPYFQADFTQDLTEWSSPLVNPGLMYRVNQMHFDLLSIYRWAVGDDMLGYQHVAALIPLRRNHTVGLTVLGGGGLIDKTDIDETGGIRPLGKGHFQDVWFIGNYSWRLRPQLVLGTNLKLRLQNQFGDFKVSHVPGMDLGVYYNPMDHYRFGDVGLSLCIQDLLPTQINWKESSEYPEVTVNRVRVGVRYALFNDNLIIAGEYLIDNLLGQLFEQLDSYAEMFKAVDSTGELKGNFEIAHRGGFHLKYQFIPSIWLKAGWTNNNIPYLGFNYNLLFTLPEMINYVNVDAHLGYSFIEALLKESNKKDERGFTIAGKVSIDFGPTREQRESKRLYDKLILAPMDAYNEAMRLYLAGKYWEAGFAFGKVLSLFPNFHLNDKATWYLGNSYRFLYMNDIARQVYKEALEEYTTSETRSKYLYGLQALDYREGNYDDALKNHAFIINLYGESDIRPDADYLAGEVHFQRKNYNVAEQLLGSIPPGDPNYLYAQYTLAIINVENDKEQAAVQNLTYIITDTTQEASDQLLQDAANTKLGHLYYEMGDQLRQAVEAYQRVPVGSPYGDEALLGTAWAWIKVNQPNVALQTIERLLSNYSESPLVPEGFLVKGYALMLLRRNAEAMSALEQCLAACKRAYITEEDLNAKRISFEEYTQQYAPVADRIKKNALRKPTNKTIEERPELQKNFERFAKESKDYFNYQLLAKSHGRFFKRKEEIVVDAEYALAKATRMVNTSKETKLIEQHRKQETKIEQRLDDLKKELEGIQDQDNKTDKEIDE